MFIFEIGIISQSTENLAMDVTMSSWSAVRYSHKWFGVGRCALTLVYATLQNWDNHNRW